MHTHTIAVQFGIFQLNAKIQNDIVQCMHVFLFLFTVTIKMLAMCACIYICVCSCFNMLLAYTYILWWWKKIN